MKKNITWNLLSKYRSELFGISIISIIVFHYFEDINVENPQGIVKIFTKLYLLLIGSLGVEIFVFLSGLGLYYSLKSRFIIREYAIKRIKRTVIPYLLYGGLFWYIIDILIRKNYKSFFMDYSLLSFWLDGNKNLWFVTFIIVMYIIFPFLFIVSEKPISNRKNVLIWLCLGYVFVLYIILKLFPIFFENTEIALMRVPVFILGIYCGKKCYEKEKISKVDVTFILLGVVLKVLSVFDKIGSIPMYGRLTNIIYSFFVMFIVIAFLQFMSNKKLNNCLRTAGKYSYELYLTSVTTRTIMNEIGYETYRYPMYILCIFIALVLSFLLVKIERWFDKSVYKKVLIN